MLVVDWAAEFRHQEVLALGHEFPLELMEALASEGEAPEQVQVAAGMAVPAGLTRVTTRVGPLRSLRGEAPARILEGDVERRTVTLGLDHDAAHQAATMMDVVKVYLMGRHHLEEHHLEFLEVAVHGEEMPEVPEVPEVPAVVLVPEVLLEVPGVSAEA